MRLYLRYMVSSRCKNVVKDQLKKLNIKYSFSIHGAIIFLELVTDYRLNELKQNLKQYGIILLSESESLLIDKIINTVIEVVHNSEELPKTKFADLLSYKNENILRIFSDVKGMSVLQYIVFQKIEKAKELLVYENFSLLEISEKLNYKNERLFIRQFEKLTGLSPDYFIEIKNKREKNDMQFSHNTINTISGYPARSVSSNM